MTFDDLMSKFGSVSQVCAVLGRPASTVYQWKRTGIPRGRQCEIELLTQGDLKADVAVNVQGDSSPGQQA